MDWVLLIGRILFATQFLTAGLGFHLRQRAMATEYARSQGAPLPELTVPGTGVVILVAGAMVILGFWVDLAALALAVCVLGFAYWMHAFWKLDDPMEKANQMAHFFKNVQIAGGALILFFLFYEFGEAIDLTIGDPSLFND
jgi:putative oxidoreductase